MGGLANLIRWHNFEGILVYLLLVVQMTSLHLYCENKFTDLKNAIKFSKKVNGSDPKVY